MMQTTANLGTAAPFDSADSIWLLESILDRVERECLIAKSCSDARDAAGRGKAIGVAIRLVDALTASVDPYAVPEVTEPLMVLCSFIRELLARARHHPGKQWLDDAIEIIQTVHVALACPMSQRKTA